MSNLTVTLVRGTDGSIDVRGSLAAFEAALHKHVAERETETATIAAAVNQVFDNLAKTGARANMPYVKSATLTVLNALPGNFNELGERVAQYIRDNAGEDKLFTIGKGKGGGVARNSDKPAPKPEAAK